MITKLVLFLSGFLVGTRSQRLWTVNSVGSIDAKVAAQTDLSFTFQSSETMRQGDCIQIKIQNPYLADDPASYKSFKTLGPLAHCQIENQDSVECTALTAYSLQIRLTGEQRASTGTLLQGRTMGSVFTNPYSTRRIQQVSVTHYRGCDVASKPIVEGTTRFPNFLAAQLPTQSVTLTSSSQEIGVTDATLKIAFQSVLGLRKEGRLQVKSPKWYLKRAVGQEGVSENFYTDSMISFDSELTIDAPAVIDILSFQFQQSSDVITVSYAADRALAPGETVTLTITNFKNPPSQRRASGFQVMTQDSLGYIIEESQSDLSLSTDVNIPRLFNDVSIEMLGNENGERRGQISSLQQIEISFSLASPLQPFCYFELAFPSTLTLGNNVQLVTGSGIFKPYENVDVLNMGGQYSVDKTTNSLTVQGCRLPDPLSATPYGTLTISLIQLPNYVQDLDPIAVKVYADEIYTDVVVDDSKSARILARDLTPGDFIAESFKPSNYYAAATNVVYNINVRPQHSMKPDSRIVIEMPPNIQFDQKQGCKVVLTICNCSLDASTNTLTLTNIFSEETNGGILIKFTIVSATNPYGARPAGPWSIRSETPVDGVFFVVDGQSYAESFTALSGTIFSDLTVNNLQVSSSDTLYSFSLITEHDIPRQGKLLITFPDETPLKSGIKVLGLSDYKQQGNQLTFAFSESGVTAGTPIAFQIKGVQNVRSMAPSSKFVIQTADSNDFVIDAGGQDIIVQLNQVAYFNGITVENVNKTNGATGDLVITLDLKYPIWVKDTLHLTFPAQVKFSETVSCTPGNSIVQQVTCTHTESELQITFNEVQETRIGTMIIRVHGIQNPRTFEQSDAFTNVHTRDALGYDSQAAQSTSHLRLQTDTVANIQTYKATQETEEYGIQGELTLTVQLYNPVSRSGTLIFTWPEEVQLFDNTFCRIMTQVQIQRADVCQFDRSTRTLRIQNAFLENKSLYSGSVQIYLSRVQNPITNEGLSPFTLTTFDDAALNYPLDKLSVMPQLKCFWSCRLCGTDKNYCSACWQHKLPYLFSYNWESKCLDNCPNGWTSNGSQPPVCQQCDVSCATCADSGNRGDNGRCLKCAEGYNFFQPVGTGGSGLCLTKCAQGYFDNGKGICLPCDSNCGDCVGSPDKCTYCHLDSALPVLLDTKCVGDCPSEYVDMAGICELCQSPCASCTESPSLCTSCDGADGLIYSFGATCVSQCPEGTKLEESKKQCTGCMLGCDICDVERPELCLKCSEPMILFERTCWASCPEGSIQTFDQSTCLWLSALDTRLVYFPFLIVMLLVAFVSWIGNKVKPKHLVLTNFVIMMAAIEHLALLVQVVLTFIYGFIAIAIIIVLIWLGYIGTQVAFAIEWKRKVHEVDPKFTAYRLQQENFQSTKVRSFLATIVSWKYQKLLYSRFFGLHVNQFMFSDPATVQRLMLVFTALNIGVTFVPLLLLNIAALFVAVWGTQLYIMLIENAVIALVMSICCAVEHRRMVKYWAMQTQIMETAKPIDSSLKKKNRLQMKRLPKQYDREHEERFNFLFLAAKTDELLFVFGGRHCKSDFHDTPDKEQDTRQIWSWPATPRPLDDLHVDDPPQPWDMAYFNNCYAEAKEPLELKKHNGEGYNKGCQKGGPFDGDLLRADTAFISNQSETEMSVGGDGVPRLRHDSRKQGRGRKNRYFKQIDTEDHIAGVNLSSITQEQDNNRTQSQLTHHLDSIREEEKEHAPHEHEEAIQERLKEQRKIAKEEAEQTDKLLKQSIQANTDKPALASRPRKELPDAKLRNFNEIDILGKFDRDKNGNVLVLTKDGQNWDQNDRRVTQQGYLLDESDDIVRADDHQFKMFTDVIGGVLPAPFCFERYNFNPFALFGNFKGFKQSNDLLSAMKGRDKQGNLQDQLARQVNLQGFLVQSGNIVNQHKQVVFDRKQLDSRGCIQPLFTYNGQKFLITDVMGTLKLSSQNEPIKMDSINNRGQIIYKDLGGHLINTKGYLIDTEGNIVNRAGKVIWRKCELKNGEFPKIFAFSKFNMSLVKGSFETGEDCKPILKRSPSGSLQDDNGVRVNKYGFLIDTQGNIVDKNGNVMFEKQILSADGKLPSLFMNREMFGDQSDEELSSLLHEIEGQEKAEIKSPETLQKAPAVKQIITQQVKPETENYLNSSIINKSGVDLDDSRANLIDNQTSSQQNIGSLSLNLLQAHNLKERPVASQGMQKKHSKTVLQKDDEGASSGKQQLSGRKRNRTTKNGIKMVKVEKMFEQDIKMASAYGGQAQPRVRMIPMRFMTTQRERPFPDTLRESSISNKQLGNRYITNQPSQRSVIQNQAPQAKIDHRPPSPSNAAYSIKDRMQITRKRQLEAQLQEQQDDVSDIERELAELYQQDVEKFIDGSNFEVESLSGFSQLSKGSFASLTRNQNEMQSKTKALQAEYLRKLEEQKSKHRQMQQNHQQNKAQLKHSLQ